MLQWSHKATDPYHKSRLGNLRFFGTRPNWAVSYIAYTKFHLPKPVFDSPDQIYTRIGEQASASFPACKSHNASDKYPTIQNLVTEMCNVHISVTKWCIVGYLPHALWDLWEGSKTWQNQITRQLLLLVLRGWKFNDKSHDNDIARYLLLVKYIC